MSDLVTVETYSDPTEAALAKNDLIASGIKAVLLGVEAHGLWNVGTEMGAIKLQVAAADAERAAEILSSPARFGSDEELAEEAESTPGDDGEAEDE